MSELALSEGWLETDFSNIYTKIVGGGTPSKANPEYFEGAIPWMSVKDMKGYTPTDTKDHITKEAIENSATNLIPKGVPIIATRMSLGKIIVANFDTAINQDLKAIFLPQNVLNPYFVYWYRSKNDLINSLGTGTTVKGIRLNDLKNLRFTLCSLSEQKEIIKFLDSYLTTVSQIQARLDAIPKLIEKFRQSVLQDFLLGNNDTLYESHVLGDIVDIISGVAFKKSQYAENGSKLLQISNVGHGSIKWQSKSFISHDLASEFNGYKLSKKDIILALNRPITHNKLKVATISDKDIPSVLYQRVARLRVEGNSKVIDSEYLFILMQSDFFRNIVTNKLKGSDQPYLNFSDLKSFSLEMPKLEYQVQLVEKIKKLFLYANQIEKSVATAKARVDSLTQSILHQAFTGNLTQEWREQNPELISGDNSAKALLAKIKAEKKLASKA